MSSIEKNKALTNPFADSRNAAKLRISKTGKCEDTPLNLSYAVNAGATLVTFTNNLSASQNYRYVTVRITDGDQEVQTSYDASVATTFTADVSAFDANKDWTFHVSYAPVTALGADCPCGEYFKDKLVGTKASASDTWNSSQAVAVLNVKVNNNTVADGGTFNFPAASVGDVVIANVVLENTGEQNLAILDVTFSGDGEANGYAQTSGSLSEGGSFQFLSITMDTATAAAKTVNVLIGTDEAANPIYDIDIAVTVA